MSSEPRTRTEKPDLRSVNTRFAVRLSVRGEAVEQAGAAGGDEAGLAAAARRVGGVPRRVTPTRAIEVAEHHAAGIAIGRVVPAGGVRGPGNRAAVRVGAGQDVVLVRRVSDAVDRSTLFV